MSEVRRELPAVDEHGETATWIFSDRDGVEHTVRGVFLGMGTSYRPSHKGHPGEEWAPQRVHCSTCRWTELRLFRDDEDQLIVVNCGASDVPGETDLVKVSEVETAFGLIESLVTRERRPPFASILPMPARRALAMAASHDADLRDAYINSPVT